MFNLIVTIVFVPLVVTLPPYNNERINEGASTSREQISDHEICEIQSYVEDVVRLLFAEDIGGGNLTNMMNNRFYELQAFYDQVDSYYLLAEFGSRITNSSFLSQTRREFFQFHLIFSLGLILERACTDHFNYKLSYEYDHERNVIVARENISSRLFSDECLCDNEEEKVILNELFNPPDFRPPETTFQVFRNSSEVSIMEVSHYHLIPISLISRFFQVWFSDQLEDIPQTHFNNCLFVLIGRLRRSIQKLLLVQIRNTHETSNEDWHIISSELRSYENPNFFPDLIRRSNHWLRGNIFLGPRNRGPFSPEFGRSGEELLLAFEHDVEPIVGRVRYLNLLSLCNDLLRFVDEAPQMLPLIRLSVGFSLFNSMRFLLVRFDVTPMNTEDWIKRYPSVEEIRRTINQTESERRIIKAQKYWAIKELHERGPRSLSSNYHEVANVLVKDELLLAKELKHRWSEFINNLIQISINARSKNKVLPWSCNLTKLYNNFLQLKSNFTDLNVKNCVLSFDEFLYLKISRIPDWNKCNNAINSSTVSDWCQAWKSIRYYSNTSFKFINAEKSKELPAASTSWSKSYLQDVKILLQWLTVEIGLKKCQNNESSLTVVPYDPNQSPDVKSNIIDTTLCFLTTFVLSECNKILSRPKIRESL